MLPCGTGAHGCIHLHGRQVSWHHRQGCSECLSAPHTVVSLSCSWACTSVVAGTPPCPNCGLHGADLARCIQPVPQGLAVDFFRASSYGAGTQSDGRVLVNLDCMRTDVAGRHVIVVRGLTCRHELLIHTRDAMRSPLAPTDSRHSQRTTLGHVAAQPSAELSAARVSV